MNEFSKVKSMIFGVLKEFNDEKRVSLLPEGVSTLVSLKQEVYVESGAGEGVLVSNEEYIQAGAKVLSRKEIFSKAQVILQISNFTSEDIEQLRENTITMGIFQPLTNPQLMRTLAEKKITVFSLDTIPRITKAQSMDVLSSQSTVAGYKAVLLAASYLPRFFPMLTTAAGTITPAKVLILGAGVAGLQAIATAKRLGAVIEAFDTRPEVKEQVQSLGAKFVEVEGAKDASGAGGYAVEQTEEYKARQREAIHKSAVKSDVIISTALIPGKRAPILITEETVKEMKSGSVIVDLAAPAGGNCQLTESGKIIIAHNVTIIGLTNIPSSMSIDASRMYGKNLITFLKHMLKDGNLVLNFEDEIISGTCIAHNGVITHKPTLNLLGG